MMCYLCKQTVIPLLEFGENKTFRYVCPVCKSYTKYKSELAEVQNDFYNGEVYNDELTIFSGEKIKQRVKWYKERGGEK